MVDASPYPTIMHSVGEAQETLKGPLPSVIALGVVNVVLVQVEPFHWSAIGIPLTTKPLAMQKETLGQETPFNNVGGDVVLSATMVHAEPFHCSIRGPSPLANRTSPTVTQYDVVTHDTPLSCVEVAEGIVGRVRGADQVIPFHSWAKTPPPPPKGVTGFPTFMQKTDVTHETWA
jgi:hypothetical protein